MGKTQQLFHNSDNKLSSTGSQFGTVVSLPISGLLCQSGFLGGWPSVFYVFGVLGVLWFIGWMILVGLGHDVQYIYPGYYLLIQGILVPLLIPETAWSSLYCQVFWHYLEYTVIQKESSGHCLKLYSQIFKLLCIGESLNDLQCSKVQYM